MVAHWRGQTSELAELNFFIAYLGSICFKLFKLGLWPSSARNGGEEFCVLEPRHEKTREHAEIRKLFTNIAAII